MCTWLDRLHVVRNTGASSLLSAWLSLDEENTDINTLLSFIFAALRMVYANPCEETLSYFKQVSHHPDAIPYTTMYFELEYSRSYSYLYDYEFIHGTSMQGWLI
jgi:ATP/maltotriose-dependent transcriptional regulator MalT